MTNQVAITMLKNLEQSLDDYCELNDEGKEAFHMAITALELFGNSEQLPSVQPELSNNSPELDIKNGELISRQEVRYKLTALVSEFEEILSHIRESEVDDCVCGLCEYDGAYLGQSGDWCNECPGFEKDDCFKLKEKYRKEWTDIDGRLNQQTGGDRCAAYAPYVPHGNG